MAKNLTTRKLLATGLLLAFWMITMATLANPACAASYKFQNKTDKTIQIVLENVVLRKTFTLAPGQTISNDEVFLPLTGQAEVSILDWDKAGSSPTCSNSSNGMHNSHVIIVVALKNGGSALDCSFDFH